MLGGARFRRKQVMVPPVGINVLASTRHQPLSSPYVMRARHFIRQYACQGIKTEQVADYVGVSRSSLEEHFRRELQCTVHQEILNHKLEVAKAMLRRSPTYPARKWRSAAASPRCSTCTRSSSASSAAPRANTRTPWPPKPHHERAEPPQARIPPGDGA